MDTLQMPQSAILPKSMMNYIIASYRYLSRYVHYEGQ